jgi:multisubunit Na+/H+ antiporter MnhB subunit
VHGHQTPGGVQGGVIHATALLLVYLSDTCVTLRRVGPMALIELRKPWAACWADRYPD